MKRRDIEQNKKMTYIQQLDCITYTHITIQTLVEDAQTYQYKYRYEIQKHINKKTDVKLRSGGINPSPKQKIKILNTKQTRGKNVVKCANVSNITYI